MATAKEKGRPKHSLGTAISQCRSTKPKPVTCHLQGRAKPSRTGGRGL
jgi:hypothetical protein